MTPADAPTLFVIPRGAALRRETLRAPGAAMDSIVSATL
jgi:hypothetical protein